MISVTHIFWGLTYGGIETMLVNIVNAQYEAGAIVNVIIINDMIEPELRSKINKSIGFVSIGRKRNSFDFGYIKRINRSLDKLDPDVIHLHYSAIRNFINDTHAKKSIVVVTEHDIPKGEIGINCRFGSIIERKLRKDNGNVRAINRVDHVFSISNTVAKELHNRYMINSTVVENGINTSCFIKRNSRINNKPFQIVQVSRLEHEKKGQDLLIEALSIIREKVDLKLTFIGEGPSSDFLRELSEKKGTIDIIEFLGAKSPSYISEHLKDYDLFVQPSRFEGFGLTVAEAMASNVPVLVTAGQGPSEVTEGDRYGWTFSNGNVQDLAERIIYIIRNYQEAQNKATNALKHVSEKYDVSITANKYLRHYELLLNALR